MNKMFLLLLLLLFLLLLLLTGTTPSYIYSTFDQVFTDISFETPIPS